MKGIGLATGLGLVCVVLACGCGGPETDLKLRLKPGDKHVLRVRHDIEMKGNMMGPGGASTEQGTVTYACEVESVDATGLATVKVTYKDAGLLGIEGPFGSSEDPDAPSLVGLTFTMMMRPDGTVESVTGVNSRLDEIADAQTEAMRPDLDIPDMIPESASAAVAEQMAKMDKEMAERMAEEMAAMDKKLAETMAESDAMVKEMMRDVMREQYGDEATRDELGRLFGMYPDGPVAKRDSWKKTHAMRGGPMPLVATQKWKMKGVREGVATLALDAELTPNLGPEEDMEGIDFQGSQTGTMELDVATGWPIRGTQSVRIKVEAGKGSRSNQMMVTGTFQFDSPDM